MKGWKVGLAGGKTLMAIDSPNHARPLLGVRDGDQVTVYAEFISAADMDALRRDLDGIFFIPTHKESS